MLIKCPNYCVVYIHTSYEFSNELLLSLANFGELMLVRTTTPISGPSWNMELLNCTIKTTILFVFLTDDIQFSIQW